MYVVYPCMLFYCEFNHPRRFTSFRPQKWVKSYTCHFPFHEKHSVSRLPITRCFKGNVLSTESRLEFDSSLCIKIVQNKSLCKFPVWDQTEAARLRTLFRGGFCLTGHKSTQRANGSLDRMHSVPQKTYSSDFGMWFFQLHIYVFEHASPASTVDNLACLVYHISEVGKILTNVLDTFVFWDESWIKNKLMRPSSPWTFDVVHKQYLVARDLLCIFSPRKA